jgi:hypothetical protein
MKDDTIAAALILGIPVLILVLLSILWLITK